MVKHVATIEDLLLCQQIRRSVFVEEQGIDQSREMDSFESSAEHFLLVQDNIPAGTVRYRPYDQITVKIERMAVLKEWRGYGLGRKLLSAAEQHALQSGYQRVILHAQSHAKAFYASAGYNVEGDTFYEENIMHYKMVKILIK